jgi:hypothetical protein
MGGGEEGEFGRCIKGRAREMIFCLIHSLVALLPRNLDWI